jgi:hypothetical protein
MMARAALSVVFSHGRDDELAGLRRRVAQLEEERGAACWATLCQAGLSFRASDSMTRSLIKVFISTERWGVAPGVQYADGLSVPPGPLNFAADRYGDFLHLESVLVGYITADFQTGNWRSLPEYMQLVQESGFFRRRPGGLFERFPVTAPPRMYHVFNSDLESEGSDSEGSD